VERTRSDTHFPGGGGGTETLKVHRQCPLVLVNICWVQGRALGREKGKALGSGVGYD
jgi:hypothetical protein